MRHPLGFTMTICDQLTGAALPELCEASGATHVVARPGGDFVVKVGMEPPDGGRECPARLARAALYVDGRDVGYWVRLVADRSPTERFSGFPDGRGGRGP